jgi:hypothetical protein
VGKRLTACPNQRSFLHFASIYIFSSQKTFVAQVHAFPLEMKFLTKH